MPTLEFKGKQFVYAHHLGVPFRELKLVPGKSLPAKGAKPSLDDNLIIHGDNLEALKALLPTHAGKVDCIFIDPPYNTGNEGWCYNDNVRSPLMKEWLKKSANPVDKEDLERHDKWLCMMWPRLHLLRELLSESGTIFISIDDIEVARLRAISDEIFGEDRFVAEFVWKSRVSEDTRAITGISTDHEYVLCYSKDPELRFYGVEKDSTKFSNPDSDPRGPWRSADITGLATKEQRPNLHFNLIDNETGINYGCPPKGWRYDPSRMEALKKEKRVLWPAKADGRPRRKLFESEIERDTKNISTVLLSPSTSDGTREVKEIFGDFRFDFPKPSALIQVFIEQVTSGDSVILDSFAGSGTTAHAVLEANAKDGGNRRFILVECEDYADTLTAERVRRVIGGYSYTGKQKTELYRESITWSAFDKKRDKIAEQVESIERTEGTNYDRVSKQIKDGVLTVTGERDVKEKAPGLGGSFAYCELGEPIDVVSLLTGKGLPSFDALARYVFYTATGQSLEKVAKASPSGFIGETDLFRVHLFYQPQKEWLRSNDAALNAARVEAIKKANPDRKRTIVFAVAKFMSQKELAKDRIEFCQLPYAIHRVLGD